MTHEEVGVIVGLVGSFVMCLAVYAVVAAQRRVDKAAEEAVKERERERANAQRLVEVREANERRHEANQRAIKLMAELPRGSLERVLRDHLEWRVPVENYRREHGITDENAGATPAMEGVTPTTISDESICLVCKSPAQLPMTVCPVCDTAYHSACWSFNHEKCARYGCGTKKQIPVPAPWRPFLE